jgi:hypothetical protein
VLLEAQVVKHQHLTFVTNKTTFFFNDNTKKSKHKKQGYKTNLQKTFQALKKPKRQNDIKLTFATKKCQYI